MTATTYNISLPQFEGPFDLLLFFIERDELDIHDIPISKITNDFLEYIRQMEALDIDLASDFILVAATLMRIKAKMLIPRKPVDEEGNEVDPREELVARLLEYKRYKSVLENMRVKEEQRASQTVRGNALPELQGIAEEALVDAELESLTLFKLLKAYERVMQRIEDSKKKVVHKVYRYNITIHEQQIFILTVMSEKGRVGFDEVFGKCTNRVHAIVTFLAMLELLNLQKINIVKNDDVNVQVNEFWIEPLSEEEMMEEPDVAHEDENDNGAEVVDEVKNKSEEEE